MNSLLILMTLLLAFFCQELKGSDGNDGEIIKLEILSKKMEKQQIQLEALEKMINQKINENNANLQKISEEKLEQINTHLSKQENQIKSIENNLIQKMEKQQMQLEAQEKMINQQNNENKVKSESLNKQIEELKKIYTDLEKRFENKIEQLNSHFERLFSIQENKNKELETNSMPIGFLYTQLPNTSSPQQLWPKFKWMEITKKYSDYNSTKVNESLKYKELASIESNLLKEINKFIIHHDKYGNEVFLITYSDEVYAFGSNFGGRLGFENLEEVKEPTIIPELCGKKVKDIKCGYFHYVALTQSGNIYTFGHSSDGRTGNGNNTIYQKPMEISVENQTITTIDCTRRSTFALTQSGQLYWFGSMRNIALYPTKVVFPSEVKIKSISCGWNHILAQTADGKVFSWGRNEEGQLGLGYNNDTNGPQMISLNENIKQIYCGYYHSLLLTDNGKVYSMGLNQWGQLGIGNKENQNIPQLVLTEQKEICCYYYISMSFDKSNKLYIWGQINGTVDVPVLSDLTSFQEIIDDYAYYHSTIKPISSVEMFKKDETKIFKRIE